MAERIFTYLKTAAPAVTDDSGDGYFVGDMWLDETNDIIYQAIDVTVGAAVWLMVGSVNRSGQSVLTSDFNITGATTVFQDTGLSVSLPEAGTYLLLADVRVRCVGNTGTYWAIEAKLYNSTDAADVSNSLRRVLYTVSTSQLQVTAPISVLVTVAAAKTIKLYAARTFDGSFSNSDIAGSSTAGLTSLSYIKLHGA